MFSGYHGTYTYETSKAATAWQHFVEYMLRNGRFIVGSVAHALAAVIEMAVVVVVVDVLLFVLMSSSLTVFPTLTLMLGDRR